MNFFKLNRNSISIKIIEEDFFNNHRDRIAESDKSWDGMHRALADGELTWDGGEYPLNHVVLGGQLIECIDDGFMVLKTPEQVRDVATRLPSITQSELRTRYFAIDPEDYEFDLSEEEFAYIWENFESVREFWIRAASEKQVRPLFRVIAARRRAATRLSVAGIAFSR